MQAISCCPAGRLQVVFERATPPIVRPWRGWLPGIPVRRHSQSCGRPDVQIADATTIISLLHLRDIARQTGRTPSIVSEILDVRNRDLAEVTSADDVIISERLVPWP